MTATQNDGGARDRSVGAWPRVSGRALYVSDVSIPGALHVAFVYSPVPHARIESIDLAPALAVSGVVDAISHAEIGEILLGRALRDYPVLAGERVLFAGQRVAAVAAVDRETAQLAAGLVEVEYDALPAVLDATAEPAQEEIVLHPGYAGYVGAVAHRPVPNGQGIWETRQGDESVFDSASRVFDDEFRCGRSHCAPIEPHACAVSVRDGKIDIWATNKEPHKLARVVADVAGLAAEDVRVHLHPIGGDFGSKGFPYAELACYFLAARTGRPVRHTMSYVEELTTTASRHPFVMRLHTAVEGGRTVGVRVDTTLDGGAFGGVKAVPAVVVPTIGAPYGSYDVGTRLERCVSYYSNTLPGGHVRSPGEFQALFAAESQVDIIATELGIDPVGFRFTNAADDRVRRVLAEVQDVLKRWQDDRQEDSGIGMALCFRDTGAGQTAVRCVASVEDVEIQLSVPDQGAGSYTLFRRLAAETLGVPVASVRIRVVDVGADVSLPDAGAGASRVSAVAGQAVVAACRAVLQELGGPPEPATGYWVRERLAALGRRRVDGHGGASAGRTPPPGVDVRSHGAVVVELGVDRETGQLDLHRAFVVADTGRVINPVAHRGQLEGGFIYGLSQTLLEELVVEEGQVVSATLGEYRIATSADVPPLEITVLESDGDTDGPIRSVGELANVGVAPAVANAIHDAVGVRLRELPLTPERVLTALRVNGFGRSA
jgi:carbon-monoxide dehydrogenase large subunit